MEETAWEDWMGVGVCERASDSRGFRGLKLAVRRPAEAPLWGNSQNDAASALPDSEGQMGCPWPSSPHSPASKTAFPAQTPSEQPWRQRIEELTPGAAPESVYPNTQNQTSPWSWGQSPPQTQRRGGQDVCTWCFVLRQMHPDSTMSAQLPSPVLQPCP